MNKQIKVYFVAHLYVNCKGETDVSYYAGRNDVYGLHLTGDYFDENILYFKNENDAKKYVQDLFGDVVLSKWAYESELKNLF